MVGITQSVAAWVLKVCFPPVVDGPPVKEGQYADAVGCLLPPLVVNGVMGKLFGAGNVEPFPFPFYGDACLVGVDNVAFAKMLFAFLFKAGKPFKESLLESAYGGFIHPDADKVFHQFADPVVAHILVGRKDAQQALYVDSVLHGTGDAFREGRRGRMPARTSLSFCPMLRHFQDEGRDVEYLAPLVSVGKGP